MVKKESFENAVSEMMTKMVPTKFGRGEERVLDLSAMLAKSGVPREDLEK